MPHELDKIAKASIRSPWVLEAALNQTAFFLRANNLVYPFRMHVLWKRLRAGVAAAASERAAEVRAAFEECAAEERAAEEETRRQKIELRIITDRAIKEYRESIISNVDPDSLNDVIVDPNNAVDPYTADNYDFLKAITNFYEICDEPFYAELMGNEFSMLTKMEKLWEFIVLGRQECSAEERWLSAQRKRDLRREWRKDLEEELDLPDALLTAKDDAFLDGVIELKKATDPRVASLGTYASEEGLGMFAKMEKLHDFLLG